MNIHKQQAFDVIIVGGGVAGSCTAIRLSQLFNSAAATRRKILVIDERATNAGTFKVGESLPGEAKPTLQSLGVLEAMNNDATQGKNNRLVTGIHMIFTIICFPTCK